MTDRDGGGDHHGDHDGDQDYARALGACLRAARVQQRLSLQEAAASSRGVVTASLLGAYERGERRVSVHRLQQLADVYGVAVDQLLPARGEVVDVRSADEKLRLDLDGLRAAGDGDDATVLRFAEAILRRRRDLNGRVVTLRAGDVDALAAALGISVDALLAHLRSSGVVLG